MLYKCTISVFLQNEATQTLKNKKINDILLKTTKAFFTRKDATSFF